MPQTGSVANCFVGSTAVPLRLNYRATNGIFHVFVRIRAAAHIVSSFLHCC
jgi:hypothetical protein